MLAARRSASARSGDAGVDQRRHAERRRVGEAAVAARVDAAGLAAHEHAEVLDDAGSVALGLKVALGDEATGARERDGLSPRLVVGAAADGGQEDQSAFSREGLAAPPRPRDRRPAR